MTSTVYLGLWTNWSRGPVFGETLTTTKAYGNLLISFTAFFVALVTTRLWKIVCLLLHRYYSTADPQGTVHHQRQIVLRNSASPEAGLFDMVRMFWAWRGLGMQRIVSLLPLLLFAVVYFVATAAAGGFSSIISTAVGDEVLIRSKPCGIIVSDSTLNQSQIRSRSAAEKLYNSANYAQQCYNTENSGDNKSIAMACNKYVVRSLPTSIANFSAECPFQQEICRSTKSTVRLDTGYMDSNDELGLNMPQYERLAYRYVLQCAPLETKGYTSHIVKDDRGWVRYHYANRSLGPTDENQPIMQDFIYEIEDIDSQYTSEPRYLTPINLKLGWEYFRIHNGKGVTFNTIPELKRSDGDLTLIFLSGNGVVFAREMNDEWYRATKPGVEFYTPGKSGKQQSYHPDVAASPMGCLEQWQWCNTAYPREVGCGPLASFIDSAHGAAPLFNLTSKDLDPNRPSTSIVSGARLIWQLLITVGYPTSIADTLGFLGVRALASNPHFFAGIQFDLPSNQWQLDVLNWWSIILASIQASWSCVIIYDIVDILPEVHKLILGSGDLRFIDVDAALGTTDPEFLQLLSPPLNNEERKLCNNQKIRSLEHTSFSFFGLAFTFITGTLIIVASYVIEPVFACVYKRRKYQPYAYLEWISNSSLQLHRLAHEELGLDTWSNCDKEIPVPIDPDRLLASLDITDPKHPTFHRLVKREVTDFAEGLAQSSTHDVISDSRDPHNSKITMVDISPPVLRLRSDIEGGLHFSSSACLLHGCIAIYSSSFSVGFRTVDLA
ncbi:hypothetical protein F4803DRAFT_557926 [Xylaria telfairii]|nr:hypothetical protein F4803DRAFT_557926 [Xylaria telfairii]